MWLKRIVDREDDVFAAWVDPSPRLTIEQHCEPSVQLTRWKGSGTLCAAITACCAAQKHPCGIYSRMDAYEIAEMDGGYAVLVYGRPQILFRSRREAEAALVQILALEELTPWHDIARSAGVHD